MARVELDAYRLIDAVAIALAVVRAGLLRQVEQVRRQQVGFVAMEHQRDAVPFDDFVIGKRIEQIEGVLDPDVERIAGEGRLEVLPPALHGADAQLIEPEQPVAAPGALIHLHGPFGEVDGIVVETVAHRELGERVVELGIARVDGQAALDDGREAVCVIGEEVHGRKNRQRVEGVGVDCEREPGLSRRLVVLFGLDEQTRQERACRDQVGVGGEASPHRCHGRRIMVEVLAACETEQRAGVRRRESQRVAEHLQGLGVVVFRKQQLAERYAGVDIARIARQRLVVDADGIVEEGRLLRSECLRRHGDRRQLARGEIKAAVVLRERAAVPGRRGVGRAAIREAVGEVDRSFQRRCLRGGQRVFEALLRGIEIAEGEQGFAEQLVERRLRGSTLERAARLLCHGRVRALSHQQTQLVKRHVLLPRVLTVYERAAKCHRDEQRREHIAPHSHGFGLAALIARVVSASSTSSCSRRAS